MLDTEQGGKGFQMQDKPLTIEIILQTGRNHNGKIEASFKTWDQLKNIMEKEKHFNIIVYYRLIRNYRHIIDIIQKHKIKLSSTLPAYPHWTYMLLKVGGKGCSHIRKLSSLAPEIKYNN